MTTPAPLSRHIDEEVPVLIVGGGGAGLTASMLLSTLGIEALLVSALPTTSDLPKAHVLNQRTMEILEDAGVAEEIYAQGTPPAEMAATAWYAGLHGDGEDYGRRVAKLESWGAGGADAQWAAASACATTNLPQIRLEPILKRRAEALAPGRVRFNHELLDITQDAGGVTARIRDKAADHEYRVRARYVIGADGGRTLARQLGVSYEGLGQLTDEATVHATVDLARWGATDPDVLLRWIWAPDAGVMVVTAPMGPTRWGADSEEWVIHLNYPIDESRTRSDDEVVADVRHALGLQDADIDVHRVTRWRVEAVLASAFRVDRVFLVGDAAHRHPPTGGLGLTSAVQDVHNLCWKLAAVLRGEAADGLLDTYEAERRPVVARNCQRSLENAVNHFAVGGLIGVTPENSREENWAALRRLWSDDPADAGHRAEVMRAIRAQSMEFREQNVEYGYAYDSAAVVADGTPAPALRDDVRLYEPSTRPGAPLPHAWVEDETGTRRATKDLVAPGRFLLVAGEDGAAWCEAARAAAARLGVPLDAVRIGHLDGDLYDPRCTWLAQRGIAPDGAILVRPDRFVAWRSVGAADAPEAVLCGALEQVLARPPQSPTTITIEESAVIRPTFHHVNLKTTRLQEMIDWYTTVCGVEVQHQDEFGAWLTNDAANHRVALLAFPNFTDDPDKENHTGLHHSAFEYDSFDDMMASYVRLRDAGITPAICLDHGMTFSYYYADPDGNNVELQVDTFGDWAASSAWMRESDTFRANPIGMFVEPEQVLADHAAGVPFAEIHERATAGAYAPEQAPVAVPHAEV